MKLTSAFKKAYQSLNPSQRQAVDNFEGPMMVVAGPGTGKTQTIATRIASIIANSDTDPSSILALTFTESGARAMRERLVSLIGTPGYYVEISTFHSFCTSVINDNPDHFSLDPSAEPLSELEHLQLIHDLLDDLKPKIIYPPNAPYHYTRAIISALSDLKREGISPADLAKILSKQANYLNSAAAKDELKKTSFTRASRNLEKQQALLSLYQAYQKKLLDSHRFDFDDMIISTVEALTSSQDLLLDYQERFQYFLVDEYQDTNTAQNTLMLLLTSHWGPQANLFVVGDPDQCIYRFSGASIENQLSFMKHFPSASVVTLSQNYRSTQEILDSAHSLISHNNLRINDVVQGLDPSLKSASGKGAKLRLISLSSQTAELISLAKDIKSKLESGVSPSEIAIIYRNNNEAPKIIDVLKRYNISYHSLGGTNILTTPSIMHFLKLLRTVEELKFSVEDENLFTLLHYPAFKIDSLDILKLIRYASSHKLSLFDTLSTPEILQELALTSQDKLISFLNLLNKLSQLATQKPFTEFFELSLNESGFLTELLDSDDYYHQLARFNTLFDEVKRMNKHNHQLNLTEFLNNISLMQDNNLRLEEASYLVDKEAVTLTTAHSAKGLEWSHVYLPHLTNKHWGNKLTRELLPLPDGIIQNTDLSKKEKNEDERRLFYVALTRGKLSVTLSYAREYSSATSLRSTTPSMFIEELGSANLEFHTNEAVEKQAISHLEKLLLPPPTTSNISEQEFLTPLVENFSLSVTSLNTYLACPYKFKLDKLLRVPRSKKPHLAFGTAVHSALESFYRQFKQSGNLPSLEYLLESFKQALKKELLTDSDHELRHAEGIRILTAYYHYFQADFTEPLFLEKFFRVQLELPDTSQKPVTLTGKIDRIEWLSESERLLKVIDYKTGKGKTLGQIKGETKDSRGDLQRQLVFYRLLIELDQRLQNASFGSAELDFVSVPADKNKSGRHTLSVSDQQLDELKELIQETIIKIRELSFPRTTDHSICKRCPFLDHCYPDGLPT